MLESLRSILYKKKHQLQQLVLNIAYIRIEVEVAILLVLLLLKRQ